MAQDASGQPVEIRIPKDKGIAVATSGELRNIPDVYADPRFDPSANRETGDRTQNLLCMPLFDDSRVAQLLNKAGGEKPFEASDERRFQDPAAKLGVLLASLGHMARSAQRARADGASF